MGWSASGVAAGIVRKHFIFVDNAGTLGLMGSMGQGMMWVAIGASAVACRTSLYLLRKSYGPAALPGCGASGGCDAVLSSRWARVGNVRVAALGSLLYLGLLVLLLLLVVGALEWPGGRTALFGLGVLAGGGAVWFIGLQLVVLRRFCRYCILAHVCGLFVSAIVIVELISRDVPFVWYSAGIAALLLMAMIAIQIRMPVTTYTLEQPGAAGAEMNDEPAVAANGRSVSFHGGKINLNLGDWPLVGSADAPDVLAKLVDYTCEDCRYLHRLLKQVRRDRSKTAVLSVPVPMDFACNPDAWPTDPRHANACQYARCALAVWLVSPAHFEEFDEWLFQGVSAPPIIATKARAAQLVGAGEFAMAWSAPEVDAVLRDAMKVYRAAGGGLLPKLLLPRAVLFGRVPTAEELGKILDEQLAVVEGSARG
jgi:uncharacterized membrane protein